MYLIFKFVVLEKRNWNAPVDSDSFSSGWGVGVFKDTWLGFYQMTG